MLNKLSAFLRQQNMVSPGDTVICAVSGGADSVALLFGLYLMKEKLEIRLEAAHFNHHLRGEESDRDERFVRDFCDRYEIPVYIGSGVVTPGKKGLEAAARDARYAFLRSIPGKIATAHTADDNAETILLHLVRGTGLKGLGGIMPVNGNVIRPMLSVTREEVEAFLEEWCLPHIEDSSNDTDAFLRNRLRHHVMPLLRLCLVRTSPLLSQLNAFRAIKPQTVIIVRISHAICWHFYDFRGAMIYCYLIQRRSSPYIVSTLFCIVIAILFHNCIVVPIVCQ